MAEINGTIKDNLRNQHSPYKLWTKHEFKQIGDSVVTGGLDMASLLDKISEASSMCDGAPTLANFFFTPIRKVDQKQFMVSWN